MSTGMKAPLAVIGALMVWAMVALFDPSGPSDNNTPELASAMCRVYVKQRLKAPATASFVTDMGSVQRLDSTGYQVTGAVDAQNSFGANLRTKYGCILRYHRPGDRWELVHLSTEP